MSDFNNKVVIITGASSGIGAATAVEFARAGASVVLVARTAHKLQHTAHKCQQAGAPQNKVHYVCADLMEEDQVQKVVQEAVQTFGKIDVVANIAGAYRAGGIEASTVDDLDFMYRVNVRSIYMMTKACVPHLIVTQGNIVNMSSVCGLRPTPGLMTYSIAHAAVDQLTKCTAIELAPKGVRVNSICPGTIQTEIFSTQGHNAAETKELLRKEADAHPLGRVGQISDVTSAILYLTSSEASFVTGSCFPVDGGRHIAIR